MGFFFSTTSVYKRLWGSELCSKMEKTWGFVFGRDGEKGRTIHKCIIENNLVLTEEWTRWPNKNCCYRFFHFCHIIKDFSLQSCQSNTFHWQYSLKNNLGKRREPQLTACLGQIEYSQEACLASNYKCTFAARVQEAQLKLLFINIIKISISAVALALTMLAKLWPGQVKIGSEPDSGRHEFNCLKEPKKHW